MLKALKRLTNGKEKIIMVVSLKNLSEDESMNMNPAFLNLEYVKNNSPKLRYDGKRPFAEWQKEARAKLAELLGMHKFEKCEENFNLEYTKNEDGYTEYRFTIQSEEGYYFPSVLRVPEGKEGKYPLMICLQGHSTGMHISLGLAKYNGDENLISGGDRDFAVRAVKEGYAALAIEMRNFGECGSNPDGSPNCYVSSMTALINGRTTIGERVWDTSRAIDAVISHFDMIDADRIFCMGNSGGGTATYYIACIEERVKAAMPSCAVCTWEESIAAMRHCTCNHIPHIAEYFNMGDLAGLIAPRGLVIVNGKQDTIFLDSGVNKCFELAKTLYGAAGAEGGVALVTGPEGHRFYADAAWPVFKKIAEK